MLWALSLPSGETKVDDSKVRAHMSSIVQGDYAKVQRGLWWGSQISLGVTWRDLLAFWRVRLRTEARATASQQ